MNEDAEKIIAGFIINKLKVQNVVTHYQVINYFNQLKTSNISFRHLNCCFTIVCKQTSFLELSFASVSKILASSELNTTSELEAYHAANNWVNYNIKKRSKFAKDISLKVRLPLLSENALKDLQSYKKVSRESSSNENEGSFKLIDIILENKDMFYQNKAVNFHTHRHCNQQDFYFLLRGISSKTNRNEVQYYDANFNKIEADKRSSNYKSYFGTAFVNGEIHHFDSTNYMQWCVKKYSRENEKWQVVAENKLKGHVSFRLCVFMSKIFIIGGFCKKVITPSCSMLDTSDYKMSKAQNMKLERLSPACAVFRGNVVVSGGRDTRDFSNTVEVYNLSSDTWSYMPSMKEPRYHHSLVAMRNKMFVVGGHGREGDMWHLLSSCEVYDARSEMFSFLKKTPTSFTFNIRNTDAAVSMGCRVVIFGRNSKTTALYDVDKDEWSEVRFKATRYSTNLACLKLPQIADLSFSRSKMIWNGLYE